MKIVQLTPGTGSFYCGSCLRDHALVKALRRLGHQASLAPLYLPLVLEESPDRSPRVTPDPPTAEGPSNRPIFFGGINVYLQQKLFLFRKTPIWLDRWLDRKMLLRLVSQRAGMTAARDLGPLTISMLEGEDGRQVKELNLIMRWLHSTGPYDVVCLSNALLMGLARAIKQRLGIAVVCTLQGEDWFLDSLEPPHREQAWKTLAERCRDVDAFIAVSHYYGNRMRQRLGLPDERMNVVYNGIDLEGYKSAGIGYGVSGIEAQGLSQTDPRTPNPVLGFLARMCRAKGLHTLVEAFVRLKHRDRIEGLKLRVAGAQTAADTPFVRSMRDRLAAEGLSGEAEFLPNLNRAAKMAMLRSLSIFSVPATYGESFGLYVLESLASGVPVVQPRHGAFPELLGQTGGGILVAPDDAAALADSVESLLLDDERRRILADEGQRNVLERFGADRMAKNVEQVLRSVAGH